jgi:hypothetical protein
MEGVPMNKGHLFSISYIAIWILVLFQGFLALALLRRLEELRNLIRQTWGAGAEEDIQEADSLPTGSKAPGFKGVDARTGKSVGIHNLDRGGVLLFLSSECRLCRGLAESFRQYPLDELPPIIAVCRGGIEALKVFGKRLREDIPLISEGVDEIAKLYHVSGYPTSVVIGPARIIRGYGNPADVEGLRVFLDLNKDSAQAEVMTQSAILKS